MCYYTMNNMNINSNLKTVLVIAGHDPSGGAGVQADIEAIRHTGCHAATVISATTVQNTQQVYSFSPREAKNIATEADKVLQDIPISAIKLGMLASTEIVIAVTKLIKEYPEIPVIIDPVLAADGGNSLSANSILHTITQQLLPLATVATPNSVEARKLTNKEDLDKCAQEILSYGCKNVLITGTHENEDKDTVTNILYETSYPKIEPIKHHWSRLPHRYHGSGCTLSSYLAALIAQDNSIQDSTEQAQILTMKSLENSYRVGKGQCIPNRLL